MFGGSRVFGVECCVCVFIRLVGCIFVGCMCSALPRPF